MTKLHNLLMIDLVTMTLELCQFNDPLKKSNAHTFHDLYKKCSSTKKRNTDKIVKEDRDIMQRLFTAYEADRPMPWILQQYCALNFFQNHWHWWMVKAK